MTAGPAGLAGGPDRRARRLRLPLRPRRLSPPHPPRPPPPPSPVRARGGPVSAPRSRRLVLLQRPASGGGGGASRGEGGRRLAAGCGGTVARVGRAHRQPAHGSVRRNSEAARWHSGHLALVLEQWRPRRDGQATQTASQNMKQFIILNVSMVRTISEPFSTY